MEGLTKQRLPEWTTLTSDVLEIKRFEQEAGIPFLPAFIPCCLAGECAHSAAVAVSAASIFH